VRLADAFERVEGRDLAEFVEHLRLREAAAPDKPAPGDGGGQAVCIMTIHAAKGLQFPVVFVADLAAAKRHTPPAVLVDAADLGSGMVPRLGVRLPKDPFETATTPSYLALAEAHASREIEEEKRCLYVACTRAEELLVLSGACDLEKDGSEGGALIDWVREAIGPVTQGHLAVGGSTVVAVEEWPEAAATVQMAAADVAEVRAVCPTPPSVQEPVVDEAQAPASVSYSALHLLERCPLAFHARHELRLGRIETAPEQDPLAFGSAVHAALSWGMGPGLSRAKADAIARAHGLGEGERERLDAAVGRLLAGDLAQRVRSADRSATEHPLLVALDQTVLVGAIDLIAWEADRALVVDYKSGRAPDEADSRIADYRLQAECYALAALASGAGEVEVRFVFVEHEDEERTFVFDRDDRAEIEMRLNELVARIGCNAKTHLDAYDPGLCGRCAALRTICPVSGPGTRD
jgi:ATP-dependent helicase/nuclease subunit A